MFVQLPVLFHFEASQTAGVANPPLDLARNCRRHSYPMQYIWAPPLFASSSLSFTSFFRPQARPLKGLFASISALNKLTFARRRFASHYTTEAMDTIDTLERLSELRRLMTERKVDIYIVPSEDSHQSEYIADCDARRRFISGFSGSSGCAVITPDKAILSTDGRYYNQATKQLDGKHWELHKQGKQGIPDLQETIATESAGGKVVAVDPTLFTPSAAKKLSDKIKKRGGSGLVPIAENLVDIVWGKDRPARPSETVKYQDEKFSGKDIMTKLSELRKELEKRDSAGFVVSMLDEIAWLFNLRGSDIPYNPVFFSYAIVTPDSASLYVDSNKLNEACQKYLADNGVALKPYDSIWGDVKALKSATEMNGETQSSAEPKKFMISNKASWELKRALGGDKLVEETRSPIADAKAVKTDAELEGMRQCHIRDGVAFIKYFAWLEDQLVSKKAELDEVVAADKLEQLRSEGKDYVGLSFPTISSTGPNAAVIHYKPERCNCPVIDPNAIYLCDSGAQYLDGTTDVTRTVHFGVPTEIERKTYTLVLKGNMALDMEVFPKGTTGLALDAFARQFLWREGLDYSHGTGHGVGSYLNVHEGPIGIGTRKEYSEVALAAGNVTSIEPGYYEDGSFGIRIENMAIIKEVKTKHCFGDKPYLGFEHITMAPYCRNLIDTSLLTEEEKQWLNDYSELILEKTQKFFENDPLTMAWLKKETQPF